MFLFLLSLFLFGLCFGASLAAFGSSRLEASTFKISRAHILGYAGNQVPVVPCPSSMGLLYNQVPDARIFDMMNLHDLAG